MQLIIINGQPSATEAFSYAIGKFSDVLFSQDIHELIHARRSAQPPRYAVVIDDFKLDFPQLRRHFPDLKFLGVSDTKWADTLHFIRTHAL